MGSVHRLRGRHIVVSQSESGRHRPAGFDLELGCDAGEVIGDFLLVDVKVVNFQCVPSLKSNGLPDSLGKKTWSPVPTVLIGGFAGIGSGSQVFFVSIVVG